MVALAQALPLRQQMKLLAQVPLDHAQEHWMLLQEMAAALTRSVLKMLLELDSLPPRLALPQVPPQQQQVVAACQPQL